MAYLSTTIRPSGRGSSSGVVGVYGVAGHFDAVNEVTSNGDTDYIYVSASTTASEWYITTDLTGAGGVANVTVYCVCKTPTGYSLGSARPLVNIGGTSYYGSSSMMTTTYQTISKSYNTNPATGVAWTVSDVNNLQLGVELTAPASGETRCTQIYATVQYTPKVAKLVLSSGKLGASSGSKIVLTTVT